MRLLLSLLLFFLPAFSADDGEFVVLPEQRVHKGDYFAAGSTIEISGVVEGDVYAFGSHVAIDGKVEGTVVAFAGSIDISGDVLGNARLFGGQVEIKGRIAKNLTAFGGSIQLASRATIGGNAVITAGHVELLGDIGGNTIFSASNARMLGSIGGNVNAFIGQLRLGSKASIGGNLEYSSSQEALIDPSAQIGGTVKYQPSAFQALFENKWKKRIVVGGKITAILMNFLFSFVSGWILVKLSPKKLAACISALKKHPWRAFWTGLLVVALIPIACLVLFITILGFPLAIALLAFSFLGFYAAKIIPLFWFSNRYFCGKRFKENSLKAFSLALILFLFVIQIPFLGSLLSVAFTLTGLGALFLSRLRAKRKKS